MALNANANFSKVNSIASPLSELASSDAKLSNADVASLQANSFALTQAGLTSNCVVAFSPTDISTAGTYLLNASPGLAAGTSPVTLPAGAQVTKVITIVQDPAVPLVGLTSATVDALDAGAVVANLSAAALATINGTGGAVVANRGAALAAAGTAGGVAASLAGVTSSLRTTTVGNVTAGAFKVIVCYDDNAAV